MIRMRIRIQRICIVRICIVRIRIQRICIERICIVPLDLSSALSRSISAALKPSRRRRRRRRRRLRPLRPRRPRRLRHPRPRRRRRPRRHYLESMLSHIEPSSNHLEPSWIQEGTHVNILVLAVVLNIGGGLCLQADNAHWAILYTGEIFRRFVKKRLPIKVDACPID